MLVAAALSPSVRVIFRGRGSIRQTLSNVGVGLVFLASQVVLRGALVGVFAFAARLVPWKLDDSPWAFVLAFVAIDFVYYVQHRVEHAVPVLWAIHAVHHQARDYNLSVSLRVGALASVATAFFHASLAPLGVSTRLYAAVSTAHAVLLFGLHARTLFALGRRSACTCCWRSPERGTAPPRFLEKLVPAALGAVAADGEQNG